MGLFFALPLLLAAAASSQTVEYEVRFPNAVHHEAEIAVTFPEVAPEVLEVLMSRTSPGRYALHEFAKNIYRVKATDGSGRKLAIARPNPDQWNVSGHHGTVRVTYTLFGDRADGTYVGIDESHAHLNMPAAFVWARGMEKRPIRIRFEVPEGLEWRVATQLKPTGDPFVFEAPDLYYFLDSPAELSAFDLQEWKAGDGQKTQTIRLAVHHQGTGAEVDAYAKMVKAVVLEEAGIFGELPRFDFGAYTFLMDYLPWAAGDGMEHRNSTYCSSQSSLEERAPRLIGTVAHEFFHSWNVERLRPRSLEPFDFEKVSVPKELWFAEGFTSYYTTVILKRAGLISFDTFASNAGRTAGNVLVSPGREFVSPVEASLLASLTDGASWADPTNARNTYISYYGYGAAVALGLDLTLRTRFHNVTLDDYMQALWETFGRTEKPYTVADLEATLGRVTKDKTFARDFFEEHIQGRQVVDYQALLAHAGMLLRPAAPDRVSLGEGQLSFSKEGAKLQSRPRIGSPSYEAGLSQGATITEIDEKKITSRKDWDRAFKKKKAGGEVDLKYEQRGRTGTAKARLAASPRLEVVTYEQARMEVTPAIKAFRAAWLGSKAVGQLPALKKYCPKDGEAYPFPYEYCPRDGQKLEIVKPAKLRR